MPIRITGKLDQTFKTNIQRVTKVFGKKFKVFAVLPSTREKCPNCLYDAGAKTSRGIYNGTGPKPFTGKVCPVCNGDGVLVTAKRRRLSCNVRMGNPSKIGVIPTAQGDLADNEIELVLLPSDIANANLAEYFLVDGIRYKPTDRDIPEKITRRGLLSVSTAGMILKRDT